MLYPDQLSKIQDTLTLYLPDPERVKPTYEHLLSKDDATPFPFWAKIWPSAEALSSFLKIEPHWIDGKHVLELGAGIGLPSFLMAPYASQMIISDHAPEAVALLEKNIQYLGLHHVRAMRLDWNHFPDHIKAEIVLLSDINYAPDQFVPLLALIHKFLEQGSILILATPQRITGTPFIKTLQPFIKRSVLQTVTHMEQRVAISIFILSV